MEDSLSAGTLLARRYRLIDPIGAGGMSVIWRARDEVLDRIVALKVLAQELAADQRFRDLVREEARSAAQLVHPHVTAVHDYGEMIAPDGTVTAFVVMELLSGESLEHRLSAGPLPWPEALEICGQVAQALAAAHRIGIVHRDVTPGNIMLTGSGVKVLDFGIATRVGAPDEDESDTFGTPAYVAPERLDGTPALPATDAYSVGVLLYETLTGQLPFPAATWEDLAEHPRHGVPPAPSAVAGLPAGVAELCRRCLSRAPQERPTAEQVAEELTANLPHKGAEPAPPQVITLPVITGPGGTALASAGTTSAGPASAGSTSAGPSRHTPARHTPARRGPARTASAGGGLAGGGSDGDGLAGGGSDGAMSDRPVILAPTHAVPALPASGVVSFPARPAPISPAATRRTASATASAGSGPIYLPGTVPASPRRAQPEPGFGGGEHATSSSARAQPEPVSGGGEHATSSSARAWPEAGFGGGEHALSSPAGPVTPGRPRAAITHQAPATSAQVPPRGGHGTLVRTVTAVAAAVVVLVTAAVVAMAMHRPGRTTEADAPGPASPAPGSPTPTLDQPLTAPRSTPTTASAPPGTSRSSRPPTSAPAPTADETITAINQIINQGLAAETIRPDAGTDLRQLVGHLQDLVSRGQADLAQEAEHLRDKVTTRNREGAIDDDTADALEEQLQQLAIARY